ncbi:MAG: hypothetical protein V5B59_22365 [Candidatus Accumulibacter contiguus]
MGVEGFDEDDLYAALDWLASQQERIERELYRAYVKAQGQPPVLVLYDVTSSYFEGECNELGQYGYHRDGKRGKPQILDGRPDTHLLPGGRAADGSLRYASVRGGARRQAPDRAPQRNRAGEGRRREDKWAQLQAQVAERNAFVQSSRRASAAAGLAALQRWAKSHKLSAFVTLTLKECVLVCTLDKEAKAQDALLDGCYLLETDVPLALMDAKTVDARYRDLQKVERNFRIVKTTFLEIRPIFLRKAERTKAHVFVAMLALKITRRFEADLHRTFGSTEDDPAAITPDDALVALGRLTYLYTTDRNGQRHTHLPRPDDQQAKILSAIGLSFPLKAKADKLAA